MNVKSQQHVEFIRNLRPVHSFPPVALSVGFTENEVDIVGHYPIRVSSTSQLNFDLNFISFAEEILEPGILPEMDELWREKLQSESLVSAQMQMPGDRSVKACWTKMKQFLRPYRGNRDVDLWEASMLFLEYEFAPVLMNSRVMEFEEALHGLDLSKSPGPMFLKWNSKGDCINDPEGRALIDNYWDELATDDGSFALYGARLKDELRPIDKVRKLSTRIIQVAPVTHFVASARLFRDQNDRLIDSNTRTSSALGISRYNGEWENMMLRFPDQIFDGDAEAFDSSVRASDLWDLCRFRYKFLPHSVENYNRCKNVYRDMIIKNIQLVDGTVVLQKSGLPSGAYNTSTDGTMHNFRGWAYCWLKKVNPEPTYENYLEFKRLWELKVQGDDVLLGNRVKGLKVSDLLDGIRDAFNVSTLHPDFVGIEECVFLAQKTIRRNGRLVPVPDTYKGLSSLITNHKGGVENCLARALGLRMHHWYNEELLPLIEGYIRYLLKEYPFLYDTTLLCSYLPGDTIDRLYVCS